MKRVRRNVIHTAKLRPVKRKQVCPRCGAGEYKRCFRVSAGAEYQIPLKYDHKERR